MTMRRNCLIVFTVLAFAVPATAADSSGHVNRDLLRLDFSDLALLSAAPSSGAAQAAPEDDPDLDIDPLQADFTVITMPTTLRMPRGKSAFRVTHRFTRPLGQGDFGSLAEDFFGIDSGAVIGLEYRFGIMRGTHVGVRRTRLQRPRRRLARRPRHRQPARRRRRRSVLPGRGRRTWRGTADRARRHQREQQRHSHDQGHDHVRRSVHRFCPFPPYGSRLRPAGALPQPAGHTPARSRLMSGRGLSPAAPPLRGLHIERPATAI